MSTSTPINSRKVGELRDRMSAHVEEGAIPGLVTLIAHGDQVKVDTIGALDIESRQPMRRDTIFRIASMTKPVIAVAVMMLVEDGTLRMDDPVERWLPELANRKVLRRIDGPVVDTVPAKRAIHIRDLMTMTAGYGAVMASPGQYPIQRLLEERGLAPGAEMTVLPPDEWLARFEDLPLLHQPGEEWHYDTASDMLGILIARATGKPLSTFLEERLFAPLGMHDTAFFVPQEKLARLPTCYTINESTGERTVHDPAEGGFFSRPPAFESGAGGLVSTVDDFLIFARLLLHGGELDGRRLISERAITEMTTDHLVREQKDRSPFFPGFWDTNGWGYGVSITTMPDAISDTAGRYGWSGGFGTAWTNHPAMDAVVMFMSQQLLSGPMFALIDEYFEHAYAAID